MVLHLSGHRQYELLVVETEEFVLTIKGRPIHPTVDSLSLHRDSAGQWVKAEITIDCPIDYKAWAFDPFVEGLRRTVRARDLVFPCFFENQTYEVVIEDKSATGLRFFHENRYIREAVTYVGRSKVMSGLINFHNDIGLSQLEIWNRSQLLLALTIEVFPAKIEYRSDYFQLLSEVTAELYNLAFDFLRRTYFRAQVSSTTKPSPTEFYSIIRYCFQKLLQAVEHIKNYPHHRVVNEKKVTRADRARRVDYSTQKWLVKNQQLLVKAQTGIKVGTGSYLPRKIIEKRKMIDMDTFENQFVKWVLTSIWNRLHHFQEVYVNNLAGSASDPAVISEINSMKNKLHALRSWGFFSRVGDINRLDNLSLVLQMAPGYQEVYKYYLMLLKGLNLQSDIFRISLKDLALLYEYWCFLKIHSILREKYCLESHNLIRLNHTGLTVSLDKSRRASIHYTNPRNQEEIVLAYNNLYNTRTPTTNQQPDNMLTIKKSEGDIQYQYVFDAKYRLNPAVPGSTYYSKYRKPGPQEDDINTMHRYRDAILYTSGESGLEKTVFGAYILFPYKNGNYYAGETDGHPHTFFSSIEAVNVGGLPFLPGETRLVEELLDELIIDSADSAFERAVPHVGSTWYYEQKFRPRTVLVGVVRDQKQLTANLAGSFYHIPYQQIRKDCFYLDYVALYQPERTFGKNAGIYYYGSIAKMEVLKRKEITELPSGREELYVKFSVKGWEKLPEPIKPVGYGVRSHIYTTMYLLKQARELPELSLTSEAELRLWKEIRRLREDIKLRVNHRYLSPSSKVDTIEFGQVIIKVADKYLHIGNGEREELISSSALLNKPRAVLKTILRMTKI